MAFVVSLLLRFVLTSAMQPLPVSREIRESTSRTTSEEADLVFASAEPPRIYVGTTTPPREWPSGMLCIFTLLLRGSSNDAYAAFDESCRCLRQAMPSGVQYDQVTFLEGSAAYEERARLSVA